MRPCVEGAHTHTHTHGQSENVQVSHMVQVVGHLVCGDLGRLLLCRPPLVAGKQAIGVVVRLILSLRKVGLPLADGRDLQSSASVPRGTQPKKNVHRAQYTWPRCRSKRGWWALERDVPCPSPQYSRASLFPYPAGRGQPGIVWARWEWARWAGHAQGTLGPPSPVAVLDPLHGDVWSSHLEPERESAGVLSRSMLVQDFEHTRVSRPLLM